MSPHDVRRLALALPDATEHPHHGFASFRRRTIFATLPDEHTARIMLPEGEIIAAAAEWEWAEELMWGKKLSAVSIHLPEADADVVSELLQDAWDLHG